MPEETPYQSLSKRGLAFQFLLACLLLLPTSLLLVLPAYRALDLGSGKWSRFVFGEMREVGLFYAYFIFIAGGIYSITVLKIQARLKQWAWPFLILQGLVAVFCLYLLRFFIFSLGMGGYLEPLVEGVTLHLIFLTLFVFALRRTTKGEVT